MPELLTPYTYNYDDSLVHIYDEQEKEGQIYWEDAFKSNTKPSDIYLQFPYLKDRWLSETVFFSDPNEIYSNENYRRIIGLGKKIIPYLIEDLETTNTDWIFALHQITGEDPIEKNHTGKFGLMKSDWLNWADETGWRILGKEKLVMEYAVNDSPNATTITSCISQSI